MLSLALLLLAGCKADRPSARYGLFGSEAVVSVRESDRLILLTFPSAWVEGYAMYTGSDRMEALQAFVQLPAEGTFGTDGESLASLRMITGTLAARMLGIPYEQVTDSHRIAVLADYADDLRKTALPDTLQRLSGLDVDFGRYLDVGQCRAYDVGTFVTIDTDTDWEALRLKFGQWLQTALLPDRRGEHR
jgi:hypothetical protein